jgi:hypothetical protein
VNSMLKFIDADYVANEISLMRDSFRGTVLLVEGFDDARFFDKILAPGDTCRVSVAFGKSNALEALALLRQRRLGGDILLVLDADFWRTTGQIPSDPDIVLTEFHDLEMDMIASGALDDVLREVSSPAAIEAFSKEKSKSPLAFLIDEAYGIGLLRFLNYRDSLLLDFKAIELAEHVDHDTLSVSLEDYLADVLDASSGTLDAGELLGAIDRASRAGHEKYQIARGHDCIALLCTMLRLKLASCPQAMCEEESVCTNLRLAYTREHFDRGLLARSIREWEDSHSAVVIG